MASKKSYVDLGRLCDAVQSARVMLQPARENILDIVKQLAGHRYSQGATGWTKKKTYLNLAALYLSIVGRNLFSKKPRVMLSTFDKSQKPVVGAMETWVNEELERMDFEKVMKRMVMDALICMGITKVSMATPSDSATKGWNIASGAAFADRVDFDDFVFDPMARDFNECGFIGHRYTVPLDTIRDSNLYNRKAREKLVPLEGDRLYNAQGDERIGTVGRTYHTRIGEYNYEDMVELWEIYCPRHRTLHTFADDVVRGPGVSSSRSPAQKYDEECLREQNWIGPDEGPYRILSFGLIPGNLIPKGPLQDLIDLHDETNINFRKLAKQARRQKTNTSYRRGHEEDARRIQKSDDGDLLGLDDPEAVKELIQGGPNQGNHLFVRDLIEKFNWAAGNLATMGGLMPQANTLGQEELLAQQSNGQIAAMQAETYAFVGDVTESLLWFWWHDPNKVLTTKLSDAHLPDMNLTQNVFPGRHPDPRQLRRQGKMPQIKIDPYSMRYQTPQQKLAFLTQMVTQIFIPMAQVAQQQGIVLDMNALFTLAGKYGDSPDLSTIFNIQEPPPQETASSSAGTGSSPAETTRNYVRRSLGGKSAQANSAGMETELEAGANGKPKNMMGGASNNGQGY